MVDPPLLSFGRGICLPARTSQLSADDPQRLTHARALTTCALQVRVALQRVQEGCERRDQYEAHRRGPGRLPRETGVMRGKLIHTN